MTHYYSIQIFYEDTDALGVVYHANYIKYMERARTVFLQEKGLSLPALIDTFGIQFVVRGVSLRFEKPVRLQQKITIVSQVIKLTKASLTFVQNIYLDPLDLQTMVCSGEVVVVCTNLQFKPCAMPYEICREFKGEN